MAKVFAPNKEYTGVSASVPFVNGVGESDDPILLGWFRDNGYEVESAEKLLSAMKKDELLAIAAEMGLSVPGDAKKDDIVKLIEAARAE